LIERSKRKKKEELYLHERFEERGDKIEDKEEEDEEK
jgi:hypothetical protein